jgi:DNA polymerase III gamma/tau subunit
LGPWPLVLITASLVAFKGNTADQARYLAALAMGSLGTAILLDQSELLQKRQTWSEILCSLAAGDYRAAMSAADALSANRDETLKFIEWAASWYRDLMLYSLTGTVDGIVNADRAAEIVRLSSALQLKQLLDALSYTVEAVSRIQRNVNRRMALEDLLFRTVERR